MTRAPNYKSNNSIGAFKIPYGYLIFVHTHAYLKVVKKTRPLEIVTGKNCKIFSIG